MPTRPNVLFILTDQFRGDCLGADPACQTDETGSPVVDTPTLNRIASRGTLFSRAYSPNPVCVPARRCLWTGQTAATNGCTGDNTSEPWHFEHTLPEILSEAGYQTHLVGKTHSQPLQRGSPQFTDFGFDEMETHVGASIYEDDYSRWLRQRGGDDQRGTGLDHQPTEARPWHREECEHPTNWTTRRALEFIDRRDDDQPFFLALSYVRPHAPLDPPAVYWDRYQDRDLPEPVVGDWVHRLADEHDLDADGLPTNLRHAMRLRRAYYALVTHIDHQINRVLYDLRWRHGISDETVVLFTADHGEMLGDHGRWAKRAPFEPSARIPMLLDLPDGVGPAQTSGERIGRPVGLEDCMPTLLDLAGVPTPATVEGQSLLDLVARPDRMDCRSYYHGETGGKPACHYIVDESTKYAWFAESGEELLFDLAVDPMETTNLTADPEYQEQLATCRSRLVDRLADREEGYVLDGQLSPSTSS